MEIEKQGLHDNAKSKKHFRNGILAIIGGMSIQIFNGCFFLWANISSYIISYMHQFEPDVGQAAIFYVDVALNMLVVVGYQAGTYLLRTRGWSPKYIVLLGGSIAISGIYASSYTTDLATFIALYGTLSGIGTGMTYMIPLVCCMEYFPDNKGLISGIIMGSYGGGSFIFNIIATKIVNPNGLNATIKTDDPNLTLFPPEVANRVPMLLRVLCTIWVGLVLLSASLISIPPKAKELEKRIQDEASRNSSMAEITPETQPKENQVEELPFFGTQGTKEKPLNLISPWCSIHSRRFWQYFWMMFLANVFGGFFCYQFKTIYLAHNTDVSNADTYMAIAASLSGVVQFITRISCGQLYDKVGFKPIFTFVMFLNMIIGVVCYQVKSITWAFIVCIEFNYMVLGSIYSVFPAPVIKTFGIYYGPHVYSLVLIAGPLVSILNLFIIKVIYEILGVGEEIILAFGSVCSLAALIICCSFDEKIDFKNMNKRGLLVYGDPPQNKQK